IAGLEHHSSIVPWQLPARDRGAVVGAVPLTREGLLDLDAVDRLLGPRTRVFALAHVSNVLGTITPVAQLAERARRAGAVIVVDGAQAAPHLPLDMSALQCDFYVFSAHKMLGPTGIGVLWGRAAAVAFGVEGLRPHDVAALLDEQGIAVRAGHHCAQPLMRWCGVVGTARASFSVYSSPEEVSLLSHAVASLRRHL